MTRQSRLSCPTSLLVHLGGNTYAVPGGDYSIDELAGKLGELPAGVTAMDIAKHVCHEYAAVVQGEGEGAKSVPGPRLYAVAEPEEVVVPPAGVVGKKAPGKKALSKKATAKKKKG